MRSDTHEIPDWKIAVITFCRGRELPQADLRLEGESDVERVQGGWPKDSGRRGKTHMSLLLTPGRLRRITVTGHAKRAGRRSEKFSARFGSFFPRPEKSISNIRDANQPRYP